MLQTKNTEDEKEEYLVLHLGRLKLQVHSFEKKTLWDQQIFYNSKLKHIFWEFMYLLYSLKRDENC